jgi:hypothetical protein
MTGHSDVNQTAEVEEKAVSAAALVVVVAVAVSSVLQHDLDVGASSVSLQQKVACALFLFLAS